MGRALPRCDTPTAGDVDLLQAGAGRGQQRFPGHGGTLAVESISRVAGLSLWRKDGTVEQLYGDDEKYKLMGWEAKDFYRYITEPEARPRSTPAAAS